MAEIVEIGGKVLAYLIRADETATETTFLTPPERAFQLGFIVRHQGGHIERHRHLPVERALSGTSEVILVRSGRCQVNLYDEEGIEHIDVMLNAGDILCIVAGGHGFQMMEDTVLLEIKQGPYAEGGDKELF